MGMKAKVWNRDTKDYEEEFPSGTGRKVKVPAGGFIMMSRSEAVQFKGRCPGKGIVKKIKIELIEDKKAATPEYFACNLCGDRFISESMLAEHTVKTHPDESKEKSVKRNPGRPKASKANDTGTDIGNDKGAN